MDRKQQMRNADRVSVLCNAIKTLQRTDFNTMMASGIMIRLTPITEGRHICDEFLINAEDMEEIKPAIIASLQEALKLRAIRLKSEIKEIEACT